MLCSRQTGRTFAHDAVPGKPRGIRIVSRGAILVRCGSKCQDSKYLHSHRRAVRRSTEYRCNYQWEEFARFGEMRVMVAGKIRCQGILPSTRDTVLIFGTRCEPTRRMLLLPLSLFLCSADSRASEFPTVDTLGSADIHDPRQTRGAHRRVHALLPLSCRGMRDGLPKNGGRRFQHCRRLHPLVYP